MVATINIRSDRHRVGAGLSVMFSYANERLDAKWCPRPPTKREWKRVIDNYRNARQLFLAELGRELGGAVLCVEMPL